MVVVSVAAAAALALIFVAVLVGNDSDSGGVANGDGGSSPGSPFPTYLLLEFYEPVALAQGMQMDADADTGRCEVLRQVLVFTARGTSPGVFNEEDINISAAPNGGFFRTVANWTDSNPEALQAVTDCRAYLVGVSY